MNFNIINGDNDYLKKLEKFVELYNTAAIPVVEIRKKLNLTHNEYRKLRKYCKEENLINLRTAEYRKKRTYRTNPRNYSILCINGRRYYQINKNNVYYCTCKTEEQAKEIVEELKKVDWDISKTYEIKKRVMENDKRV